MEESSGLAFIEMLVVYKDDNDVSKTKKLIPIFENGTHFGFINRKHEKVELINKLNVIRMEEVGRIMDLDVHKYRSENIGY